MRAYLDLLKDCLDNGEPREDRTGTGTYSLFGRQARYDLSDGKIPLLTTKRIFWKGVVAELLWILSGDTNSRTLEDQGVNIWKEWAREDGQLGRIYGQQMRNYGGTSTVQGVDQLSAVVSSLRFNPMTRRHVIDMWNPAELDQMALPPCHCWVQWDVSTSGKLSCQLYQRSCDIFLGCPFNIASYSLLTHMLAKACGLQAGEFIHTVGNLHLYLNHVEQAELQLSREPEEGPSIVLSDKLAWVEGLKAYRKQLIKPEHIKLIGYDPQAAISAVVAV